jgi:hypothetical protein
MSGGGGTTTSNSSTTVPQDVLNEYNQVTAQANQVASQPLQQYSGQTVASLTPDETSAFSSIDNMQGITAPYTQEANNLLGQASQTINPQTVGSSQIQSYESPYTQDVLNSTMAAENNQDAQQQAQLQGNAISSGAWGGDRAGVAQGILGGQQALANNATNAGIENQGYSQALSEANTQQQTGIAAQEASQSLQESAGLGENQLGTSALTNGLNEANAQLASGQLQQQQAQSELNVPYENFLQQQAYPFQTTGWLGNIAEGIGSNEGGSSTSSTTQPSEGLFGLKRGGGITSNRSHGGIVPHRDSGGDVSLGQSSPPNASTSILQHISQIPQKLRLQQAAQQSAYGTGNTQAILNDGMARGGIVPKHYDAGGGDDDGGGGIVATPVTAASVYGPDNEGPGVLSSSANDNMEMASNAAPESMPAPTPPPNAHDMPSSTTANYQMPNDHTANPWLSVAAGVLGTLAGRSRNPLVDIGQGGLIGLNNYDAQQKEAFGQNYQEGSIQQNAQKMMDERNDTQAKLKIEQQQANQTGQYQQGQLANQRGELGIRQQELQKPIFDKYGNPWQMNPQTKTYERVDATPAGIGAGASGATNNNPRDAAIDILQQEGVPVLPVAPNDTNAFKAQQAYQQAGQTAQSMLDTINHQKALIGTYTSGPRGAANTSWLPSEAGIKYGSQELAAGNSDDLAKRQEAEKDANTLAMQQSSMLKGARPGVRMIQFSGTTVPNPNMSDKAQATLADEWTDKLNQQVQRGQIASLYSGLHPKNVDAIMNNYETNNPIVLGDGSRNSNWMPYKTWIASGRPDTAQLPAKSATPQASAAQSPNGTTPASGRPPLSSFMTSP